MKSARKVVLRANGNEYGKTHTAAYAESEKIRLDVAEHIPP
jgi:hypothetical protein